MPGASDPREFHIRVMVNVLVHHVGDHGAEEDVNRRDQSHSVAGANLDGVNSDPRIATSLMRAVSEEIVRVWAFPADSSTGRGSIALGATVTAAHQL